MANTDMTSFKLMSLLSLSKQPRQADDNSTQAISKLKLMSTLLLMSERIDLSVSVEVKASQSATALVLWVPLPLEGEQEASLWIRHCCSNGRGNALPSVSRRIYRQSITISRKNPSKLDTFIKSPQ